MAAAASAAALASKQIYRGGDSRARPDRARGHRAGGGMRMAAAAASAAASPRCIWSKRIYRGVHPSQYTTSEAQAPSRGRLSQQAVPASRLSGQGPGQDPGSICDDIERRPPTPMQGASRPSRPSRLLRTLNGRSAGPRERLPLYGPKRIYKAQAIRQCKTQGPPTPPPLSGPCMGRPKPGSRSASESSATASPAPRPARHRSLQPAPAPPPLRRVRRPRAAKAHRSGQAVQRGF